MSAQVENEASLTRVPFNDRNPGGPLELCTCTTCGTPIMLDDKLGRVRVAVPNIMGYDDEAFPPPRYSYTAPSKPAAQVCPQPIVFITHIFDV